MTRIHSRRGTEHAGIATTGGERFDAVRSALPFVEGERFASRIFLDRIGQRPGATSATAAAHARPATAALLVLVAMVASATSVSAQTTLVSNLSTLHPTSTQELDANVAHGFTTGTNAGGYTVSAVVINLASLGTEQSRFRPQVSLWTANSDGTPEARLALGSALGRPASIALGSNTYSAAAGGLLRLAPNTKYFVVIGQWEGAEVKRSSTDAEDTSHNSEWSIDDGNSYQFDADTDSWVAAGSTPLALRVRGTADATSTSARLSALTLKDGPNGSTINLSPTFAATNSVYTASVGNSVHTLTLGATAETNGATVKYLGPAGNEYFDNVPCPTEEDADGNIVVSAGPDDPCHDLDFRLRDGNMIVNVEVTSGSNTAVYTLIVTRRRPLSATFTNVADSHDGSTAFNLDVEFTEDLDTASQTRIGSAVSVQNGYQSVLPAAQDGGTKKYRLTITPSSSSPVRVSLRKSRNCTSGHSICSQAGGHLGEEINAWVGHVGEARLQNLRIYQLGGPAAIWSRTFSPDNTATYDVDLRSEWKGSTVVVRATPYALGAAVTMTGSIVESTSVRSNGDTRALVRLPDRGGRLTLTVASEDGLSTETYRVQLGYANGLARIRVMDTVAYERPGAQLVWTVTLLRPSDASNDAVSVDYETENGGSAELGWSAASPDDYVHKSGTLHFPASSAAIQTMTVSVDVVDDSVDDDNEYMGLVFSNPVGATLDGSAWVKGTISNSELTAAFENLPEAHDGANPFTFRVAFNFPTTITPEAMQDDALAVTSGTLTAAERVDGRADLFELTVQPSGTGAVSLSLPGNRACSEAGAVCATDDRQLSATVSAEVAGPGGQAVPTGEALPTVSIAAGTSPVTEGTAATFDVRLDKAATASLTVSVSVTEDGSVLSGTPPASVTLGAGDTSATLSVPTEADSVVEANSTVTATVTAGTGYTVGSSGSAGATVEDDDSATFTVSAAPETIAEGETATLTVAISNGVTFEQDQTISLDLSASTATSGSDFTVSPESLTLSAGSKSATASVTAVDDTGEEGEEMVAVSASHNGTTIGTATVAITANDATLLTAEFLGMPETHDGTAAFNFHLVFSEEVDVGFETLRDAAFEVVGGTIRRAQRITQGSNIGWSIRVRPDSDADVVLVLPATSDCAVAGAVCTAAGKPLSNRLEAVIAGPALPEVSITTTTSPVTEGTPATFEVTLDEAASGSLTVQVAVTEDGSALSGTPPASVTFNAGDTSATLSVPTEADSVVEANSTVSATVTAGSGYTVGSSGSARATVEDDDSATFTVSAAPQTIDEGQTATLTVAISNGVTFAQDQTISLDLSASTATSGSDFTVSPESLTLSAGSNSVTATVTAVDDTAEEGEETIVVAPSRGGTSIGTATVTITANDVPPLRAEFMGVPETHDGTAFTFELHFSEEIAISFRTLRDAAFDVTGGTVRRAQRITQGSNLGWTIRVRPDSDSDVVLVLPVTTDCESAGAVCTADGKPLSSPLQATVRGPGSETSSQGFPLAPENSSPSGIWSDGETAWVADLADARLYAYQREDGERKPEKDIATEPSPMGLWSDGETLWVAQQGGGLKAYRLADGARLVGRDLALEADTAPAGVWSDGETAWVSDWLGDTVHAYRLEDGRRAPGRDIKLAGDNLLPMGLWSDRETLWVADWRERMYAYRLSDGERMPELDLDAGSKDEDPSGLWSGDGTLLSTSWKGGDVHAYPMPELAPRAMDASQLKGLEGQAASAPPIADPALLAAIRVALGKAPRDSVSAAELAGLEALEARNTGIQDLTGLAGATSLKELDLGFNPVADFQLLALLPGLESVNLDGTTPDLHLLASLVGLKRLSLRNTGIDDLQPLASLLGLTELDVGDNRVADLSPLTGLQGLTALRADRNRIVSLWPLAALAGLETLELGANAVRDLRPLAGLTQLRSLHLEGNRLTALYPLAGLDALQDLGLARNAVESIGVLGDLDGLRRLDLRGNAVQDLRPLSALPSLVWVHVGGSQIKNLAPLDNVPGLTVAGREDRDSPGVAGEDDVRESRQ